jgi:hypothetical protein
MPKSPTHAPSAPSVLPKDVALQVAECARVPPEERDQFCDLVYGTMLSVWERDRRGLPSKPGQALRQAEKAARILHEAFGGLNQDDRKWVERLLAQNPWYQKCLSELPLTIWRLAHLFSTAMGKAPPPGPGNTVRPGLKGRRVGSVKDATFRNLVRHLMVDALETGGQLKFDKTSGTGSLIEALRILRPYLPEGVVPLVPPSGTIQFLDFYAEYDDLEIYPPKSARRRRNKI